MSKVLERIIKSKRLPTLFIGAGISKRYLADYLDWNALLNKLREQIGVTEAAYTAKKQSFLSKDYKMSHGKLNQYMASFLQETMLKKIELNEIDLAKLFTKEEYDTCVNKNVDFFKMLAAKTLKDYSINDTKKDEIELLKKISQKTSMVFTTNYDLFLEKEIFDNFKVYGSQDKYYFRTNNGYGELFKIHGSVLEPNGMIITANDYERFDEKLKLISSKLINALMDFPIIFLGYSLEDENIKKILQDFVNCFDDEILQDVKRYMILVIHKKGEEGLIEGEKQFTDKNSNKHITLTTLQTDNFKLLYEYIDKLHPTATTYELRRYKTMIADIINKAAKGENNIFVQDLEDANDGDKALYIGTKESIDEIKKTYNTYTVSDIIVKILKKEKVDYERLAKEWYEANNIPRTLYTPVFYIKAKIKTPMDKTGVKFRNNYDGRKKAFERMEINKGKSLNYDDMSTFIEKEMKNETAFLTKCNTICNEIMYSLKNNLINSKDATKIFLKLHEGYPEVKDASPFKKATCYMWYLEFENKKSTEG